MLELDHLERDSNARRHVVYRPSVHRPAGILARAIRLNKFVPGMSRHFRRGHGFEERVRGSHHLFRQAGVEERINLQREGGKAKVYQIRQVRAIILSIILERRNNAEIRKHSLLVSF